ncbi:MAG: outer membrane lipoprotein carrier protein LolA [Rhodobacteraceae bacterium]|jgi:outer membrane lipoprotein-sorting protein|nr:outer membrane lipoprotein carrier protein LolA [Paracoccaceae bacterium]
MPNPFRPTRRGVLIAGAAGLVALPLRAQQILSLQAISAYLNGITTAEAPFTQTNADGTRSTGRLFIRRPGRIRFEYDPPERALVVAGGGMVAIFDGRSNERAEQYPIRRTPLHLILADRVDLTRARMVVDHGTDGTATTVTAQDPERPEEGTIRLVFRDGPLRLTGWVITDGAGYQTTTELGQMATGMTLSPFLFDITYEENRRGG